MLPLLTFHQLTFSTYIVTVLGFDIFIDEKLKPWLLEVNRQVLPKCNGLLVCYLFIECRCVGVARGGHAPPLKFKSNYKLSLTKQKLETFCASGVCNRY